MIPEDELSKKKAMTFGLLLEWQIVTSTASSHVKNSKTVTLLKKVQDECQMMEQVPLKGMGDLCKLKLENSEAHFDECFQL